MLKNKILTPVLTGAIFGCVAFLTACSGETSSNINASNKAVSNQVANAPTNVQINNLNATSNSSVNNNYSANANTMTNEITYSVLSNALKQQIQSDDLNDKKLMSPEEWQTDKWKQMPIGAFYKNVDKIVGNRVCDVTIRVLEAQQKRLHPDDEKILRQKVTSKLSCDKAVDEMRVAANNSRSRLF